MRRWTHGHSILTGVLVGLTLAPGHPFVLAGVGLLAGVAARELVRASRNAARLATQLAGAKLATERARAHELRTRTRHRSEANQAALKSAYWRGARDGAPQKGSRP